MHPWPPTRTMRERPAAPPSSSPAPPTTTPLLAVTPPTPLPAPCRTASPYSLRALALPTHPLSAAPCRYRLPCTQVCNARNAESAITCGSSSLVVCDPHRPPRAQACTRMPPLPCSSASYSASVSTCAIHAGGWAAARDGVRSSAHQRACSLGSKSRGETASGPSPSSASSLAPSSASASSVTRPQLPLPAPCLRSVSCLGQRGG